MRKVILDTSILVDYAVGAEPTCSHCKQIISMAAEGSLVAYASLHSLKDTYFLTSARLKHLEREQTGSVADEFALAAREASWAVVRQLGKQLQIVSVGRTEHEQAFVYRAVHNDYEDNLVLAAAQAAKADLLVTNDKDLIKHSPLAALSSADAVALLAAEQSSSS